MNPILLARHVEDSLRELVHATLNTTSPAFDGTVERFLQDPGNFLKGPWISADMPFQQVGQTENWAQPFPEIPLGFRPFRHQSLAFERLGGSAARSTLIATGTGSGKTESYLWPILDYCRQHKDEPGIKAILIYPMNALASDQARRIAKALTEHPSLEGVTAGVYADAEPEDAAHAVTPESLITHRESMRRRPPDILLTNYKMLDYLLLRGSDRRLWEQNDPQTLRYVVVDELHTFDGAQGADLALLLRRLKERLNTPKERLVCVGSSATLGSGEAAKASLQEYARTIFGAPFDEDSVIGESRKTPEEDFPPPEYFEVPWAAEIREALEEAVELDQSTAASRLAACFFDQASDKDALALETGDPKSMEWRVLLFRLLSEHHITQRILTLIYDAKKPVSLDEIAEALGKAKMFGDWALVDLRALAEVVISLLTWARRKEDGAVRPAYNIRCQLWIREMTRMAADLPALRDDGALSPITLYHAIDVDKDRLRTLLPVVNCNRCGAAAHLAKEPRGNSSYWAALEELYESFFDDSGGSSRVRLFYYDALERRVGAAGASKRIYAGVLDTTEIAFRLNAKGQNENEIPVWMYDPTDDRGRIDRTCPACGYPQGLLIFGMRGARLTTGVTSTLYTSQQNEEDPLAKPRFLMFSDSVQDAAHRGAIAELRNAFSVAQKSLHEALDQAPEAQRTLADVIEAVPAEYRAALGGDAFTAKFIARDQVWRRPYQDLVNHGTAIDDDSFLRQVQLRLGWEYFVDLTYRAHFSHTLEAHAMASVGAPLDGLGESAERLAQTLANEFPHAEAIQAQHLIPFLAGVVERMRRQGSVAHEYLTHAIELADARGQRLNWFGAAYRLRLGKTGTLPIPDNRRGRLAPVPVTLRRQLREFDCITREGVSNWYRDWLYRLIGPVAFEIASQPEVVYPAVLERLEADGYLRSVPDSKGEHRQGWLLEPSALTVTRHVSTLRCSHCARQETLPSAQLAALSGSPCRRIGCHGVLEPYSRTPQRALRRAMRSDRNHRVVAREHTGILEADERLRIEKGFIEGESAWAPNLISATPTLEMGIDIGDLSSMMLCSVPPEEANYVQRMGRSGRRDGNALNMVIAMGRPHDLQFWEDPTPMLAGEIRPPGVFLQAESVLKRQLTAFTLDAFVRIAATDEDYGKVSDVLKRRRQGGMAGFPTDWLQIVEDHGPELVAAFIARLPDEVQARSGLVSRLRHFVVDKGEGALAWRVLQAFDEAAAANSRLVEKREELSTALRQLRKRQSEYSDEEFQRREDQIKRERSDIKRLVRALDQTSVIKYLTDKGLFPNYAFPEEGVKLTSLLSRRAEDEEGLAPVEYQRPASAALDELAPGQYFYANGRQVRIERIEMTADDLEEWRFCQSCSYVTKQLEGAAYRACPRCGDEMWDDTGSDHSVITLKAVRSFSTEGAAAIRDQDQRQRQQFDRNLLPFYSASDIESAWFTQTEGASPFGFEFISECLFRDFNFGRRTSETVGPKIAGDKRRSSPFLICRHCGVLQKAALTEEDAGKHPPDCPANDGKRPRSEWERQSFLMRSFPTEAMRVVIPVAGSLDDDDAKSFVAGINLGMQRYYAGKVDHIRSTVVEEQLDNVAVVRSLYLYDAVPGGSGYLRQLGERPESMREIIERAAEALRDCPCAQTGKNGCFRCVKSYRTQFGAGEPDRERALGLMDAILGQWDGLTQAETSIEQSLRGSLVESALENRFLSALARVYGHESLTPQVLEGGRRGFILKAASDEAEVRRWTIEPQVQIDQRFRGMPRKRVDFLLTPIGQASERPIVVEMDGYAHHAGTVGEDIQDRLLMIRSGALRVWTLSWKDLDSCPEAALDPLNGTYFSPQQQSQIGRVMANKQFAEAAPVVSQLQALGNFEGLCTQLVGESKALEQATVMLLRALIGPGRSLSDLLRANALSTESQIFLEEGDLTEHVGGRGLDLYLSAARVQPSEWLEQRADIRAVLVANLPLEVGYGTPSSVGLDSWRGLWLTINRLQCLPGLHVEMDGLDSLCPPSEGSIDYSLQSPAGLAEWQEVEALCDEIFTGLVAALIAADLRPPDLLGEDVTLDGLVIGTMELGWSDCSVYLFGEDAPVNTPGHAITFNAANDLVSEKVAEILKAVEGRA